MQKATDYLVRDEPKRLRTMEKEKHNEKSSLGGGVGDDRKITPTAYNYCTYTQTKKTHHISPFFHI